MGCGEPWGMFKRGRGPDQISVLEQCLWGWWWWWLRLEPGIPGETDVLMPEKEEGVQAGADAMGIERRLGTISKRAS